MTFGALAKSERRIALTRLKLVYLALRRKRALYQR